MKKKLWIINQDASTPELGYAGRSYYFADNLSKIDVDVTLICASSSHVFRKNKKTKKFITEEFENEFKIIYIKTLNYKKSKSLNRILNWFIFAIGIFYLLNKTNIKPNTILYSSPPLIGFLGIIFHKKLTNFNLITEIRDIWPLTFTELSNISNKNLFVIFHRYLEKLVYDKSDIIISNLTNFNKYLEENKIFKDYYWIPNGYNDITDINYRISIEAQNIIENIPENKFIIGYTGSLGEANAIDYLIRASIELIRDKRFYFVIIGNGVYKNKFKELTVNNDNIIFYDSIPKKDIDTILNSFNVCYVGWKKSDLYKYGIGSNKLPEYIFSGIPILHSYSGEGDLVEKSKSGITIESESTEEIINGLILLYSEYDKYSQNDFGRKYATENLSYSKIAFNLYKII